MVGARVDGIAGGGGSDRSRRRGGSGAIGGADGRHNPISMGT